MKDLAGRADKGGEKHKLANNECAWPLDCLGYLFNSLLLIQLYSS